MIAKQYTFYTTTLTSTNSNGNGGPTATTVVYHYLYGDILVTRFNADGEVKWISKVDKYQHSKNDGAYLSSYISKVQANGDNIDLIFAEIKPRSESDSKKMEDRFTTKVIAIDKDGNQQERDLFTGAEEETTFRTKPSVVLDDKRTIIAGEGKLDFKFGLLKYE